MTERVILGVSFGLFAVASAVAWYRDERQMRRIRQAHEREMAAIRAQMTP